MPSFLRNLSIGATLSLSFGSILIFVAAVSAIALYNINHLTEQKAQTNAGVVEPFEHLGRMGEAYQEIRTNLAWVVQTDDAAEQNAALEYIYALQAELNELEGRLAPALPTTDLVAQYRTLSADRKAYIAERDVAIAHAQSGDLASARQHAQLVAEEQAHIVTAGMTALRDSLSSYSRSTAAEARRAETVLFALLLSLVIASIVLAGGLAYVLRRRVGGGLETLRRQAEAAVDAQPFDYVDLGANELGTLGRSLQHLAERSIKRSVVIDTVVAVSQAVNRDRNLERGLEAVLDGAREVSHAQYAALSVFGADGTVEQFYHRGFSEHDTASIGRLPEGKGLLGHIQEIGETVRTSDMSQHEASVGFPSGHPSMKSLLAVPIRFGDKPLGNLYLSERTDGKAEFNADDQSVIESLADIVAVTIEGYQASANRQAAHVELEQSVADVLAAMDRFSEGNLSVQLDESRVADAQMPALPRLYAGFNQTVRGLGATLADVRSAVDSLASASVEMSATVEQIAVNTHQQAGQAQDVRHAMSEMVDTINANSTTSTEAAGNAQRNGQLAREGGAVMGQTVDKVREVARVSQETASTVQRLGASSQQIGTITATISDIAEQTNLLALNATIEAARAGESGRGFAVVAEEVRKLAERTASATRSIEDMIGRIQADTDRAVGAIERSRTEVEAGVSLAEQAGVAFERIVEETQATQDRMALIASATEEQSVTAQTVAANVDAITTSANEAAHGTKQVAEATDELSQLAIRLQTSVQRFRFDHAPAHPLNAHASAGPALSGDGHTRGAVPTLAGAKPTAGGCPLGHG
jgi:methyl-accepting chemotaxis protein